jgi:arylsulfatase A-like enzyme
VPDLLVSLPAERHGSYETSVGVPSELVTLAETLRAAGFATASFCTNVNAGPQQNMDQGFDVFYEPTEGWFQDRTIPLEAAERWLDHHADRPGFVYVHTAEPHGPYTPPEGFANSFDPDYRGPIDGSYERGRGFKNASSERDLAHVMALYDEEILYADSRIGKFVESLERRGLTSRTNLFVTADHGEEFQQHGAWEHGMNLHNEQTRIPLVVAGPWVAHRGRIDAAVQLSDVMPTILDVLELPQPYPLAGQSLAALLRGEQAAASSDRRESGVAADQRPPRGAAASGAGARTIYASNFNYKNYGVVEFSLIEDGRWKAMYSFREQTLGDGRTTHLAVYDLASDPRERTNLLLKDRDRSRALFEKLVAHVRSQPPYARKPTDRPIQYDPAQLRELRSLGYIGDE